MDELAERVKELNCLYQISHLAQKRSLSFEKILQGIVELIPPAMHYPAITGVKISIDDREFKTSNFKETNWKLSRDIKVQEENIGVLVVCQLEKTPDRDRDPFLKEEKDLIAAVVERIGRIIERSQAQAALIESETRFRQLVENSLTGISIIQDGRIVYQNPEQERLLGPLPRRVLFEDIKPMAAYRHRV
jgi:PAS domain-containing protein